MCCCSLGWRVPSIYKCVSGFKELSLLDIFGLWKKLNPAGEHFDNDSSLLSSSLNDHLLDNVKKLLGRRNLNGLWVIGIGIKRIFVKCNILDFSLNYGNILVECEAFGCKAFDIKMDLPFMFNSLLSPTIYALSDILGGGPGTVAWIGLAPVSQHLRLTRPLVASSDFAHGSQHRLKIAGSLLLGGVCQEPSLKSTVMIPWMKPGLWRCILMRFDDSQETDPPQLFCAYEDVFDEYLRSSTSSNLLPPASDLKKTKERPREIASAHCQLLMSTGYSMWEMKVANFLAAKSLDEDTISNIMLFCSGRHFPAISLETSSTWRVHQNFLVMEEGNPLIITSPQAAYDQQILSNLQVMRDTALSAKNQITFCQPESIVTIADGWHGTAELLLRFSPSEQCVAFLVRFLSEALPERVEARSRVASLFAAVRLNRQVAG